jgi:predicted PurR-regulated permease PerM
LFLILSFPFFFSLQLFHLPVVLSFLGCSFCSWVVLSVRARKCRRAAAATAAATAAAAYSQSS